MATRHLVLKFKVEGLLHIGDGSELGKKDYFCVPKVNGFNVLDVRKFVGQLDEEELADYMEFLETDSNDSLEEYLSKHDSAQSKAKESIAYRVGGLGSDLGRKSYGVQTFVKDAYGCPYIPGSSVKGALRTAVLVGLVLDCREEYASLYDRDRVVGADKKRACREIENKAFWVERTTGADDSNDIMRFISVSDSNPLDASSLVFAQKFDKFCKKDMQRHKQRSGEKHGQALKLYRECLNKGTEFTIEVDIDERIAEFLPEFGDDPAAALAKAFEDADRLYRKCFLSHFEAEFGDGSGKRDVESVTAVPKQDKQQCIYVYGDGSRFPGKRCRKWAVEGSSYCKDHQDRADVHGCTFSEAICYLGGGTDFDVKTVANSLFENDEHRVEEITQILYAQFPTEISNVRQYAGLEESVKKAGFEPKDMKQRGKSKKNDHQHWRDPELGVSPHTLKYGKTTGETLLMGRCSVEIKEVAR